MASIYKIYQLIIRRYHSYKTRYWYRIFLKQCGSNNLIVKPQYITPEYITLHNNIFIWKFARIEGVSDYEWIHYEPEIILHNNVSIQQNVHITCAKQIEIEKNTAIAANVTITDIHHTYNDLNTPIKYQEIKTSKVYIGENCNIGNNAVILPGTSIGRHCTVGANSVVQGSFPDYCVIVGAPARIVKHYSFELETWIKVD